MRDLERLERIFQTFSDSDIDYVLGYGETDKGLGTYIRYLSGALIDYSLIIVDVNREEIDGIVHVMEAERARSLTWLDRIYVYGGSVDGDYIKLKSDNLLDSIKEVLGEDVKVGIPYTHVSAYFLNSLERKLGSKPIDVSKELESLRMAKTRVETEYIERAAEIVDYGIFESSKLVSSNILEKDLADKGRCEMYKMGADKVYEYLIVASGQNSSNPHWRAGDRRVEEGDIITFDYVASYEGYYADETRTLFYKHVRRHELKKIYETVLDAQVSAIDMIEPGVKASEVDSKARSIIESAGYGKYFVHSTGHGIGLEIHEKPRLSRKDNTILEEGFIITVEPGIYIPGLGGVRIEDTVLVTKSGRRVLTKLNKALTIL